MKIAWVLAGVAIAGCTPVEMRGDTPPVQVPACRTDGLSDWIGKRASDVRAEEMVKASGARTMRWIAPNTAVTMDYRPDRLNVHVDGKGVIEKFGCA